MCSNFLVDYEMCNKEDKYLLRKHLDVTRT